MKWMIRQPLWVVQSLVAVVGLSAMMASWGGMDALRNLVIAWVVAGAWGSGLNLIAQTIGWDRVYYEYERLVASPVTLPVYFAGVVAGHLPFFLTVSVAPAVLVGMLIGIPPSALVMILSLSPLAIMLGAFTSLAVVLGIRNPTNISAITNPLNTLTVVLPPVYYPLSALPMHFRLPLLAVPTVSLMEVARWLAGYPHVCFDPSLPLLSLAVWAAIITPAALRKMRWGLE